MEEIKDLEEILEEISKKGFERIKFVDLIINDDHLRDFLVDSMINNREIMKYYHCFYIISDASEMRPELFYKYWDDLANLL